MRLLLLALLAAPAAFAQPTTTSPIPTDDPVAEIHQLVTALFDGMRTGDGDAVGALIHPDASFQSVVPNPAGGFRLMPGDAAGFVAAVGSPRDQVWDERVGEVEVRVDAGLATAWMPYRFYLDDTFSHCGVNAMQLAHTDAGWQIVNLIDTRRRDCE